MIGNASAGRQYTARTYVLGLIGVAVIPVWLFAAYVLLSFAQSEQRAYRERAVQIAEQSASVLDGQLREMLIRLDGLARSTAAASDNFALIHAQARSLVDGTDQVVVARDLHERILFDTRSDFGTSLPAAQPLAPAELTDIEADRPHVSDLYEDQTSRDYRVSVAEPVKLRDGTTIVLAMTLPASRLHDALAPVVPHGWIVGVGDRSGVYVTRSERHDEVSGKPGLPSYLNKAVGNSGIFTASNQFGDVLLAGYYRSGFSGWLYGANVPLSVVEEPFWRSIYGILAIGIAALLLSGLLAYLYGAVLTRETTALANRALALGHGGVTEPAPSRLKEFAIVDEAFRASQAALLEKTNELKAVLETVPAAVWFTYDPSGRTVIRNEFAANLMGLPTYDHHTFGVPDLVTDTVALKDGQVVSRDDRPLTKAMRGEPTDHEEFLYRLPSGKEIVLLSSARSIRDASGKIIGGVQVSLDITDRKKSEEQRRLLAKELNHRVKNNLAIVQALVQQTIRNSTDLTEAGTTIGSRLLALARGHDVLTRHSWEEGDLREVIEAGLASQITENRVVVSGPTVKLSPTLVMAVTLAIHELTTNAIKYGALSNSAGRVSISWEDIAEGDNRSIVLTWCETGGPPVQKPSERGFGSRLLKRMTESAGGSATLSYPVEGLECVLVMPL